MSQDWEKYEHTLAEVLIAALDEWIYSARKRGGGPTVQNLEEIRERILEVDE